MKTHSPIGATRPSSPPVRVASDAPAAMPSDPACAAEASLRALSSKQLAFLLADVLSGGFAMSDELADILHGTDKLAGDLFAYANFEPDHADIRACNIGDYQADLQREARA